MRQTKATLAVILGLMVSLIGSVLITAPANAQSDSCNVHYTIDGGWIYYVDVMFQFTEQDLPPSNASTIVAVPPNSWVKVCTTSYTYQTAEATVYVEIPDDQDDEWELPPGFVNWSTTPFGGYEGIHNLLGHPTSPYSQTYGGCINAVANGALFGLNPWVCSIIYNQLPYGYSGAGTYEPPIPPDLPDQDAFDLVVLAVEAIQNDDDCAALLPPVGGLAEWASQLSLLSAYWEDYEYASDPNNGDYDDGMGEWDAWDNHRQYVAGIEGTYSQQLDTLFNLDPASVFADAIETVGAALLALDALDAALEAGQYIPDERLDTMEEIEIVRLQMTALRDQLTGFAEGFDLASTDIYDADALLELAQALGGLCAVAGVLADNVDVAEEIIELADLYDELAEEAATSDAAPECVVAGSQDADRLAAAIDRMAQNEVVNGELDGLGDYLAELENTYAGVVFEKFQASNWIYNDHVEWWRDHLDNWGRWYGQQGLVAEALSSLDVAIANGAVEFGDYYADKDRVINGGVFLEGVTVLDALCRIVEDIDLGLLIKDAQAYVDASEWFPELAALFPSRAASLRAAITDIATDQVTAGTPTGLGGYIATIGALYETDLPNAFEDTYYEWTDEFESIPGYLVHEGRDSYRAGEFIYAAGLRDATSVADHAIDAGSIKSDSLLGGAALAERMAHLINNDGPPPLSEGHIELVAEVPMLDPFPASGQSAGSLMLEVTNNHPDQDVVFSLADLTLTEYWDNPSTPATFVCGTGTGLVTVGAAGGSATCEVEVSSGVAGEYSNVVVTGTFRPSTNAGGLPDVTRELVVEIETAAVELVVDSIIEKANGDLELTIRNQSEVGNVTGLTVNETTGAAGGSWCPVQSLGAGATTACTATGVVAPGPTTTTATFTVSAAELAEPVTASTMLFDPAASGIDLVYPTAASQVDTSQDAEHFPNVFRQNGPTGTGSFMALAGIPASFDDFDQFTVLVNGVIQPHFVPRTFDAPASPSGHAVAAEIMPLFDGGHTVQLVAEDGANLWASDEVAFTATVPDYQDMIATSTTFNLTEAVINGDVEVSDPCSGPFAECLTAPGDSPVVALTSGSADSAGLTIDSIESFDVRSPTKSTRTSKNTIDGIKDGTGGFAPTSYNDGDVEVLDYLVEDRPCASGFRPGQVNELRVPKSYFSPQYRNTLTTQQGFVPGTEDIAQWYRDAGDDTSLDFEDIYLVISRVENDPTFCEGLLAEIHDGSLGLGGLIVEEANHWVFRVSPTNLIDAYRQVNVELDDHDAAGDELDEFDDGVSSGFAVTPDDGGPQASFSNQVFRTQKAWKGSQDTSAAFDMSIGVNGSVEFQPKFTIETGVYSRAMLPGKPLKKMDFKAELQVNAGFDLRATGSAEWKPKPYVFAQFKDKYAPIGPVPVFWDVYLATDAGASMTGELALGGSFQYRKTAGVSLDPTKATWPTLPALKPFASNGQARADFRASASGSLNAHAGLQFGITGYVAGIAGPNVTLAGGVEYNVAQNVTTETERVVFQGTGVTDDEINQMADNTTAAGTAVGVDEWTLPFYFRGDVGFKVNVPRLLDFLEQNATIAKILSDPLIRKLMSPLLAFYQATYLRLSGTSRPVDNVGCIGNSASDGCPNGVHSNKNNYKSQGKPVIESGGGTQSSVLKNGNNESTILEIDRIEGSAWVYPKRSEGQLTTSEQVPIRRYFEDPSYHYAPNPDDLDLFAKVAAVTCLWQLKQYIVNSTFKNPCAQEDVVYYTNYSRFDRNTVTDFIHAATTNSQSGSMTYPRELYRQIPANRDSSIGGNGQKGERSWYKKWHPRHDWQAGDYLPNSEAGLPQPSGDGSASGVFAPCRGSNKSNTCDEYPMLSTSAGYRLNPVGDLTFGSAGEPLTRWHLRSTQDRSDQTATRNPVNGGSTYYTTNSMVWEGPDPAAGDLYLLPSVNHVRAQDNNDHGSVMIDFYRRCDLDRAGDQVMEPETPDRRFYVVTITDETFSKVPFLRTCWGN